jgi:aspartate/methionine/tyrosine aminotransferase
MGRDPVTGARRPARLAARMSRIEPFQVMELLARAKALEAAGRSIIHMEIGEPDFGSPQPVVDAGKRALDDGHVHYTAALGLPALRSRIARFYGERYGLDLDPARVVVTSGSSGALLLAMAVLLSPGDEVLMADPGYPANRHFVRMLEGVPIGVPVGPDTGYQLSAAIIDARWDTRTVAALIASPSNPTGTMVSAETLAGIAERIRARGGRLIVDEIYHGLVYGRAARSALELGDDLFVVNSFSKYFHMTGWRLGWLVAPDEYVRDIEKLAQNVYLSAPAPAQHAALEAFSPATMAILEDRRREFERRRDFLVPALRALGFRIPVVPEGAFYVYADASAFTDDSFAFCGKLLETAGVAITPGLDFGSHGARTHVRFAYTTTVEQLAEAVERIRRFVGR